MSDTPTVVDSDPDAWEVVVPGRDERLPFDTEREAQAKRDELAGLNLECHIDPPATNGTRDVPAVGEGTLPDPLNVFDAQTETDWMVDQIDQGNGTQPHLNKRGCQVIADQLGLDVESDPVERAADTDFEYAEYRAWIQDGDEQRYTSTGFAHIDESNNTIEDLDMQAETRAKKRAVKWATGGGLAVLMDGGTDD